MEGDTQTHIHTYTHTHTYIHTYIHTRLHIHDVVHGVAEVADVVMAERQYRLFYHQRAALRARLHQRRVVGVELTGHFLKNQVATR